MAPVFGGKKEVHGGRGADDAEVDYTDKNINNFQEIAEICKITMVTSI